MVLHTEKKELEILWSPKQLAEYLTVSPVTVYRWLSQKKVIDPAKVVRIGKTVRIPRSEVERIAGNVRQKLQEGKVVEK